jgi:hypothetical protein
LPGFGKAIILARLKNFDSLADDKTAFMNDNNHFFVLSPQLWMNSGYTPSKPAASLDRLHSRFQFIDVEVCGESWIGRQHTFQSTY